MNNAEQSVGISQINTAVGQLDLITQQHAAMVEEPAAATERLSLEASGLDERVGGFKLRGSSRSASSPPRASPVAA